MPDRGLYHGERLKAKDVLRLYAAGERDFRGTILRGCNFRGADLSGADFSETCISSAQFVSVTLQKTNFSHAQIGLVPAKRFGGIVLVFLIVALPSFVQGYTSGFMCYYPSEIISSGLMIALLLLRSTSQGLRTQTVAEISTLVIIYTIVSIANGATASSIVVATNVAANAISIFAISIAIISQNPLVLLFSFPFSIVGTLTFSMEFDSVDRVKPHPVWELEFSCQSF